MAEEISEEFNKWLKSNNFGLTPYEKEYAGLAFEAAWVERGKRMNASAENRCGCFYKMSPKNIPYLSCVVDLGRWYECDHGEKIYRQNKKKEDCKFWKQIK